MSQSTNLTTFASLQNDTSATTDLNSNFSAINTALTGCLSILGQAPNQMQSNLDMNQNRLINLPPPVSINEPMRLSDATTLNGGGTITVTSQLPVGGTVNQVLGKNSSTNFDVSWQTLPSALSNVFNILNVQVFSSSATYTPTTGMLYCIIECIGGGGAGGGTATTGASQVACGGGGGAGGYARGFFSAAQIGLNKPVTIGGGGLGSAGAGGGAGSTTSVGALITATGGAGGNLGTAGGSSFAAGGGGGAGSGGNFVVNGGTGFVSFGASNTNTISIGGQGGASYLASGGIYTATSSTVFNGNAGVGAGAGGSGSAAGASQGTGTGGNGVAGIVIITEFA